MKSSFGRHTSSGLSVVGQGGFDNRDFTSTAAAVSFTEKLSLNVVRRGRLLPAVREPQVVDQAVTPMDGSNLMSNDLGFPGRV